VIRGALLAELLVLAAVSGAMLLLLGWACRGAYGCYPP
jgi:hypothetical protein